MRLLPAFFGKDLQWPSPCAWIYLVSNVSSRGVHGPLCNPTLEQQGALPISLYFAAIPVTVSLDEIKYELGTERIKPGTEKQIETDALRA